MPPSQGAHAAGPARLALVTAPDRATALTLAQGLVAQRLAACVNVVPGLISVYRWKDAVQQDEECLLVAKTSAASRAAFESWVRAAHPYEVPEIVFVEPCAVEARYLSWWLDAVPRDPQGRVS